jgi:hypothetical protein
MAQDYQIPRPAGIHLPQRRSARMAEKFRLSMFECAGAW